MTWACCGTARWAPCSAGSGRRRRWARTCAPINFGNVAQLEKAGRKLLVRLAREAPLLPGGEVSGVHRHRLVAEARLRVRQAGRPVRGHEDREQAGQGPRAERAGRDGQHAGLGAGDRRDPAAGRERRLRPGRGQPGLRGDRDRPGGRLHRAGHRPDGLRVLRGGGDRRDPPAGRPVLRHRPEQQQGQGRDRRHRRGRLDADQVPARAVGRPARLLGVRRRGRRDRGTPRSSRPRTRR